MLRAVYLAAALCVPAGARQASVLGASAPSVAAVLLSGTPPSPPPWPERESKDNQSLERKVKTGSIKELQYEPCFHHERGTINKAINSLELYTRGINVYS